MVGFFDAPWSPPPPDLDKWKYFIRGNNTIPSN